MHFDCRKLNRTVLLKSLTTSCWLYTYEQTNSSKKFAANLNMKGISFFYSPCSTVPLTSFMHALGLLIRSHLAGTRWGIILMYWNKSRLMIQQNITIFLGVDYTILWNQRLLNQQQYSCSTTISSSQHFSFFTGGVNFLLRCILYGGELPG